MRFSKDTAVRLGFLVAAAMLAAASPLAAQGRPAAEITTGWAAFPDDGVVGETLFGAAARLPISPRVSIGPEIAYMWGEQTIRDLMVTGNLWFDFLAPSAGQAPRTTPYVVVGGGLFRHSSKFFGQTFSTTEGAFTAGGGARVWLGPSVYLAPEVRVGWELHLRASVTLGVPF
ncbi:MAG: hypothetical protein A3H97_02330 [Acidobacteria bacterium RIFCSPLOWO2_02_FULL_65_29]|nr:MAG: hypothetical protein A3H97_02330 [Acidobacteria bacterium RIFCSPLOWO2_02_FULL_65_29]